MYIPGSFRMGDADARRFLQAQSFAVLFSWTKDGDPWATHVPLLLEADGAGERLIGHLARANKHWRHLDGARTLAVFAGPHAYISPAWYGSMPDVPTWNYVTVHVSGVCRVYDHDHERLLHILDRLARFYEPDSPIPAQLHEPYYQEQLRAIVPIVITVDRIDGKAKLGQNRPAHDRLGAIAGLETGANPDQLAVAALMRATLDASDTNPPD